MADPKMRCSGATCHAAEFAHTARSFLKDFVNKPETETESDGQARELQLASKLYGNLTKICLRDWQNTGFGGEGLHEVCKAVTARFAKSFDAAGLAWLRKSMGADPSVDLRKVLINPTPFLEECVVTTSLCRKEDDLPEIPDTLTEVGAVMPIYTQVSSMNRDLMKELSPDGCEKYGKFLADVESKLHELTDSFKVFTAQLKNLCLKYRCLGCH